MQKYNLPQVLTGDIEANENGNVVRYQLSGISIPMLQRDYAQGRTQEAHTLERFLDSVFKSLSEDKPMELDFVYGSIEKFDERYLFIPLDGQQRLTLLFLLYWCIGNWELEEEKMQILQNLLGNFSYATRASAKDFCKQLSGLRIDADAQPSVFIREQSWYYELFQQDPTVRSMLVVIDAIYHRYCKLANEVYSRLDNIGFYILPLGNFGLTDELYIKMNARGKQLTGFENFKVDLINWMQDKDNPLKEVYGERIKFNGREMQYHTALSIKLDNNWTKLFWNYAKENKDRELIIDDDYIRFWNRYLLHYFFALDQRRVDSIELEQAFKDWYYSESKFRYKSFDNYKNLFLGDRQLLSKAESVLDQLSQYHKEINGSLAPSWNKSFEWRLFNQDISQIQRIIHFASTRFLESAHYDQVLFQRWMRIVWNITIDPDNRSVSAMIRVIRLIDKLAAKGNSIYEYLASEDSIGLVGAGSSVIESQLSEERIKAALIISDLQWESVIIEAESHPLFSGSIGFLIGDKPTLEHFKHRVELAFTIFTDAGLKGAYAEEHILMRSTIGQITEWNMLQDFNFKDHADNWQLLLRRNKAVQEYIRMLCSLPDSTALLALIKNVVLSQSVIQPANRQHIHQQLYQPADFHEWLQTRDDKKALELKWYDDHLYVHRPASWYDRVMLDTYRNEIITSMIDELGFSTRNRCNSANFYWDYSIFLRHDLTEGNYISAFFSRYGTLKIKFESPNSDADAARNENEPETLTKEYQYAEINNANGAAKLINKIRADFF